MMLIQPTPAFACVDLTNDRTRNTERSSDRNLSFTSLYPTSNFANISLGKFALTVHFSTIYGFVKNSVFSILLLRSPSKVRGIAAKAIVTNDRRVSGIHPFRVFTRDKNENHPMGVSGSAIPMYLAIPSGNTVRPQKAIIPDVLGSIANKCLMFSVGGSSTTRIAVPGKSLVMLAAETFASFCGIVRVAFALVERTLKILVSHLMTPFQSDLVRTAGRVSARSPFAIVPQHAGISQ